MRKALFLTLLMVCVLFAPITSALDGDGDGYDDSIDICPFAAGSANSTAGMGCPDSDGDGLADFEQTIMHNWGESIRENTDYSSTGSGVRGMAWATKVLSFMQVVGMKQFKCLIQWVITLHIYIKCQET